MNKKILIRFGDLMLKGKNIRFFVKHIRAHVRHKLNDLNVSYVFEHDRIYVSYPLEVENEVILRLKEIPGIHSISVVYLATHDINDIVKVSTVLLNNEIKGPTTFKIETKRSDKSYPLQSLEITQKIAPMILKNMKHHLTVDVKHPKETLHVEIRQVYTYIYLSSIKCMGGYPFGTGGKGLMMMSGGIDSPVASYLAMKQGIEIELFHFESTPLTPLESAQKVIDLAKELSKFTMTERIKCHMVPFAELHENLLKEVYDPYIITVMRRMMYRLAERFAKANGLLVLLNGESVGQVASQTIESMGVVEAVTKMPVLRPLITYDKQDTINLAKQINTFDVSIRPFNDCCSVYVPKNPVIKPREKYALRYEKRMDYEPFMEKALNNVVTFEITPDFDIILQDHGFTVSEAYLALQQTKGEQNGN